MLVNNWFLMLFSCLVSFDRMTQVIQTMDIESMIRILENNPLQNHAMMFHLRDQVKSLIDGEVDEVQERQLAKMLVSLLQIFRRIDIQAEAKIVA